MSIYKLSEKWRSLSVAERKAAVCDELQRLSVDGKSVSAHRWDGQKRDWLPSSGHVASKLIRWSKANEQAGLRVVKRGQAKDDQITKVVGKMDKRHVLDECKRPLVVKASDVGEPYRYYCWVRHSWINTVVYGSGHFGHAKA